MGFSFSTLQILVLLVAGLGAGCGANVGKVTSEIKTGVWLDSIDKKMANSGDEIVLSGIGFDDEIRIVVDGVGIAPTSVSAKEIKFIMPEGKPGLVTLLLSKDDFVSNSSIVRLSPDKTVPLATGDSAQFCIGQKYYDMQGEIQNGSAQCKSGVDELTSTTDEPVVNTETETPVLCKEDGQVGCLTSEEFPSVNRNMLAPENIRKDVSLGGVLGSVVPSPPDCSADGKFGCVATEVYRTVDRGNFSANDIRTNVVVGGVIGSMPGSLPGCNTDGEIGCATNTTYRAALTTGLAGKVMSLNTVAGIPGDVTLPLVGEVLFGITYGSSGVNVGTLTLPSAGNVRAGNGSFGVGGNTSVPALVDCVDGGSGCYVVAGQAAATVAGLASKVLFGHTVAGVSGGVILPSVGKVLTGTSFGFSSLLNGTLTLPAISNVYTGVTYGDSGSLLTGILTLPTATNVRTSNGNFGIGGTGSSPSLADCAGNGVTGCVTAAGFTSADLTGLSVGNIKNGVTIAGVTGQYPNGTYTLTGATEVAELDSSTFNTQLQSATAFEWFDKDGGRHSGAGDANLIGSNLVDGVTIFGVGGTTESKPLDCGTNGAVGCVTTPLYQSADLTNLTVDNIKNGVTVAGTTGQYPSTAYKLAGWTGTADLTAATFNSQLQSGASFEWFDETGARQSGSGDADLIGANIVAGSNSIFGVSGTTLPKPADCSGNAQLNCVTSMPFQSADLTNLNVGNIKDGVTVAGVIGQYPSGTYLLPNASANTDLTGMFSTMSAGVYEWWDSMGVQHSGSVLNVNGGINIVAGVSDQTLTGAGLFRAFTVEGDSDLVGTNIKNGVNIFNIVGSYIGGGPSMCTSDGETGCVTDTSYPAAKISQIKPADLRFGTAIAGISGSRKHCRNQAVLGTYDIYDVGADYRDSLDGKYVWTDYIFGNTDSACQGEAFVDVTADGLCDSIDDQCVFRDSYTGQEIASMSSVIVGNWDNSITNCENLVWNTNSDWRMATYMEALQMHIDGVGFVNDSFPYFEAVDVLAHTSTTVSATTTSNYEVNMRDGSVAKAAQTTSRKPICVRDP